MIDGKEKENARLREQVTILTTATLYTEVQPGLFARKHQTISGPWVTWDEIARVALTPTNPAEVSNKLDD